MTSITTVPSSRWNRAAVVVATLLFLLGLAITTIRLDLIELIVGLFGVTRGRGALILLTAAAVLSTIALARAARASRSGRLARALILGSIITGALGAWSSRTPYRTETVRYMNGEIPITGTLYLPAGTAPSRAVVVVHGSAPFKRAFYHLWADRIARSGGIVLVADKRGVGGTGGEFERNDNTSEENIARLASDVVAGVDYLVTRPEVDSSRIGLVGLSQAGWVAPTAAVRSPRIRYMALITGPAVSTREEGRWSRYRGDDEGPAKLSLSAAEGILDTLTPGGVDARVTVGQLAIPSLWLFGSDDNSVPTKRSIRSLDSLARTGRPVAFRMFEGYGHILFGRGEGSVPQVAPESWSALTEWLARR